MTCSSGDMTGIRGGDEIDPSDFPLGLLIELGAICDRQEPVHPSEAAFQILDDFGDLLEDFLF